MKLLSIIHIIFALTATVLLTNCSSMSNAPEKKNIKVSREDADTDCRFISKLEGRSNSKTGNTEAALEDLKQEAANKGANYLQVKEYSGYGTSVTGLAYFCP